MKKLSKYILKTLVAGVAAFLCMSIFCYFYYNLPAHEPTPTGATDSTWTTAHFSCRGTEGFAYTKTDENGYVNTFPHKKDSVDILLMGSSHTEAFNVNADQNYAYLLNQKLYDSNHNMYAYSIGMSSHNLGRCLNNLEHALTTYQPSKYVVIETHSAQISVPLMQQMINDSYIPNAKYNSGIAYHLQKFDFLRLIYAQLSNLRNNNQVDSPADPANFDQYASYLDQTLQKAAGIAKSNNCTLVILYSSTPSVDYTGQLISPAYSKDLALLENTCQKYDIVFINTQSSYTKMYNETHCLPHGFTNTAIGKGHLNKYGHACIAAVLFNFVTTEEH